MDDNQIKVEREGGREGGERGGRGETPSKRGSCVEAGPLLIAQQVLPCAQGLWSTTTTTTKTTTKTTTITTSLFYGVVDFMAELGNS